MTEQMTDQSFLEFIVRAIVSQPDDVQIERTVDDRGVLLTLKINPSDMGFVIGRQGQTARAIRTLLKIVGARNNARVNLKIYDPNREEGGSTPSTSTAPVSAPVSTPVADDMDDLSI